MSKPMLPHHQRIADEYAADARELKRERRRFFLLTLAGCWAWVLVGGVLMARGLNINASVGPFYFEEAMNRAELYWSSGLFIGTAGPFATLVLAWRRAAERHLID